MSLRIDVTCANSIIDENGNVIPIDPAVSCKPAKSAPPVVAPSLGDVMVDFATETTNALGEAITRMIEHEVGAASSIVTYNKIKTGALGAFIDYQITYSEVSEELGGGLKAEIVTGGVVLKNLFFASGVSALAVQTAIGQAMLVAAGPIVTGFAVAVAGGLLVSTLFGVEINGVSIDGTFQDMFAGAYDKFIDLWQSFEKGFENSAPTFDDFIVDMAHGLRDMWTGLKNSIHDLSDTLSAAYHEFLFAIGWSQWVDPLVIDLNGDGIKLDSWQASNALFDLTGDGTKENTGWTKANGDDAFLVIDKNNNGKIDNINEMFGNATTAGFVDLKSYDSNNDNLINASDTQFSLLRLWNDKNANGVVDAGEMTTLAANNITEISLNKYRTFKEIEGNLQTAVSTVTKTDGTTRNIHELSFNFDAPSFTSNPDARLPSTFQLNIETIIMPYSRGYGNAYSWQAAMTLDPTLLAMAKGILATAPKDLYTVHDKFEAFLFRWAGVENVKEALIAANDNHLLAKINYSLT